MAEIGNTVDNTKFRGPELGWFIWVVIGGLLILFVAGVVAFFPERTSFSNAKVPTPTLNPVSGSHNPVDHGKVGTEDVPYALPVPTVQMSISPDPASGYNIHLRTTNFIFAPEHVNQDHVHPEGHAHLYVDGVKVSRIYSEWFHLAVLPPGEHTIKVVINTNDHRSYSFEGREISNTANVTVQ